ncbi:MAG TPA: FAD-dependent oxidoreductase [Actinomycetota bacterium]|nr:FAD-dependent oxidoreductase [Actinomycetota bacterium]
MARTRLVVVGGDAAGMSAASQARRGRGAEELEIVAFERGGHTSYSACGLPHYAGDVVKDWRDLVVRTPAQFAERDIDARTGHLVEAIDLQARRVRVRELASGRTRDEPWDALVVATGSEPLRPPLPGIQLPGVHGLSILQDGIDLRRAVDAGPASAVVVGGGYIGLEAAEALVNRGVPTAMVEAGPQVMGRIDPDMGELVSQAVRDVGVELHTQEPVEAIEGDGRVQAVRTSARTLPADLVVLGLGTRPAVGLAGAAGIGLGPSGAIAVNPRMRTPHDGVWAAGDCAEARHLVSGLPVNYHLGTIANKQGRVCGINLGGGYATFPGVLGTAVTRICDVEVARTGLSAAEIGPLGLEWDSVTVDSTTRAGYFPGGAPIRIKVLAERRSGRLLGAQLVGREGAAKRIDVFATAIWNGMTVDGMVDLDLSYAPPFGPVWDPVLVAARRLSERVERT